MKSRLWAAAAITVAMILSLAGVAVGQDKVSASEWVEKIGNMGSVNWTDGYIEAVGIGAPPQRNIGTPQARPMALRAAQVDAFGLALQQVAREWLLPAALNRTLATDGPLAAEYFNTDTALRLDAQVWGQGFEAPLFSEAVEVLQQRLVADKLGASKAKAVPRGIQQVWIESLNRSTAPILMGSAPKARPASSISSMPKRMS